MKTQTLKLTRAINTMLVLALLCVITFVGRIAWAGTDIKFPADRSKLIGAFEGKETDGRKAKINMVITPLTSYAGFMIAIENDDLGFLLLQGTYISGQDIGLKVLIPKKDRTDLEIVDLPVGILELEIKGQGENQEIESIYLRPQQNVGIIPEAIEFKKKSNKYAALAPSSLVISNIPGTQMSGGSLEGTYSKDDNEVQIRKDESGEVSVSAEIADFNVNSRFRYSEFMTHVSSLRAITFDGVFEASEEPNITLVLYRVISRQGGLFGSSWKDSIVALPYRGVGNQLRNDNPYSDFKVLRK